MSCKIDQGCALFFSVPEASNNMHTTDIMATQLSTPPRRSQRLLTKQLIATVLSFRAYRDLCQEAKPGIKGQQERRRALNTCVNKQIMLGSALVYFQHLAYGWKHLTTAVGGSREILEIDTQVQARR
jgi:hypothetical protein